MLTCGSNINQQLGYKTAEKSSSTFQAVPIEFKNILKVSCGWDGTAINSSNGLFVWGNNNQYQLGVKQKSSSITPTKLVSPDGSEVLDIALGFRFIVFITKSGRTFLAGQSKCLTITSKLPNSSKICYNDVDYLELKFVDPPIQVAAGQHHIVLQTGDNEVTVIGDNKYGQCGELPDCNVIPFLNKISKITCGWTHTAVLDELGFAYLWGRNNYFQLGQVTFDSVSRVPMLHPIDHKLTDIQTGSEHFIALTDQQQVFSWGWNEHGNCGVGHVEDVKAHTLVKLENKVLIIGTGAGFSFAVVSKS